MRRLASQNSLRSSGCPAPFQRALEAVAPALFVGLVFGSIDAARGQDSSPTAKVVLAELFTSSGCGPCVAADLALDKLLTTYPADELAVLAYHTHAGYPDPMGNVVAGKRMQMYGIRGAPTFFVDGQKKSSSGGGPSKAERLFAQYQSAIERGSDDEPQVSLRVRGRLDAGVVFVDVEVSQLDERLRSKPLVLHVVLVERVLSYTGENGIDHHPMVVRSMLNGGRGIDVVWNGERFRVSDRVVLSDVESKLLAHLDDVETRFAGKRWKGFSTKLHEIDAAALSVVAFVQEARSLDVLQARVTDLSR